MLLVGRVHVALCLLDVNEQVCWNVRNITIIFQDFLITWTHYSVLNAKVSMLTCWQSSSPIKMTQWLQWRLEGGGPVCCKTMNERERNLGDWQGDSWNILCGLTHTAVAEHYLLFSTGAGTWLCTARPPRIARTVLVTCAQNTWGSHFFRLFGDL